MRGEVRKALLAAVVAAWCAAGVIGQEFVMNRATVDGGGVMFSAGGDFELSGTVGQPDAGSLGGGQFTLTGGFWFPQTPGDWDGDGAVGLHDYAAFATCISGPARGSAEPSCVCFDVDGDDDVDLVDMSAFQQSFSG
jgi:hypothetical protein